jgi:formylglycine-generating enzyme required for sulfatase activity
LITYNAGSDSFSAVTGTTYPMDDASWYAAMICANGRSDLRGLEPVYDLSTWTADFSKNGYRLPTEAEYEFALMGTAGNSWTYFWGSGWSINKARQYSNMNHDLEPVASNSPNSYGLYDMIGEVYQWTGDWYGRYGSGMVTDPAGPASGYRRAVRGCSVVDSLRARIIFRATPLDSTNRIGFRLVLPVR